MVVSFLVVVSVAVDFHVLVMVDGKYDVVVTEFVIVVGTEVVVMVVDVVICGESSECHSIANSQSLILTEVVVLVVL